MLDAMAYMVPKYLLFKTPQCGTNRGDLRYDVNAVAILVDHAREAATWPSIRLRRFVLDVLMSFRMFVKYPYPVLVTRPIERKRHGSRRK